MNLLNMAADEKLGMGEPPTIYEGAQSSEWSGAKLGDTIPVPGFMSASRSQWHSKRFAMGARGRGAGRKPATLLHIRLPAGHNAVRIADYTGKNGQKEALLDRKQKLAVTQLYKKAGLRHVHVEPVTEEMTQNGKKKKE